MIAKWVAYMRWNNEAWSIPKKSVLRKPKWIHTKEKKNSDRDGFLTFYEKERLKDQRQVRDLNAESLMQVKAWRDEQSVGTNKHGCGKLGS